MVNPPPIELATIGWADSLILMVLALVVFGPRRLPQIGKQIGKLMYEFRKASNDFKFQMEEELRLSEEADRRKRAEEERLRAAALAAPDGTIESQAAVGAMESVSAPPPAADQTPANAEEGSYPAAYAAESAPAEEPARIPYPRISPPATGEKVPASRPVPETTTEAVAEANIGAETPAQPATPEANAGGTATETSKTEPVSQHG